MICMGGEISWIFVFASMNVQVSVCANKDAHQVSVAACDGVISFFSKHKL